MGATLTPTPTTAPSSKLRFRRLRRREWVALFAALAVGAVIGTVWGLSNRHESADLAALNSTARPAVAYANGKVFLRALKAAVPATWTCVGDTPDNTVARANCSIGAGKSLQVVWGYLATRQTLALHAWAQYVRIAKQSIAESSPRIVLLTGKKWFAYSSDEKTMVALQAAMGGTLSRPGAA